MAELRNAVSFLFLSAIWGTAFVAISAGLEYIPPVLFAGIRYDIAGVVMLVYAVLLTDGWRPRSRADMWVILIGSVLLVALYNAFLFIGQQTVTSGVAAILIAVNPILATVFARVLLQEERLSVVGLVGLFVGVIGVGLVVAPNPSNIFASDVVASGFVLLAAGCVALGSVLVQRIDSQISTEGLVAWSFLVGAALLHVMSFGMPSESFSQIRPTGVAILSVIYLAIAASAIGYFVYFDLLDRLGAIEINLVSYAAPVFAALFGWLLLQEAMTVQTVIGFLVICIGFVLIKREAFQRLVLR